MKAVPVSVWQKIGPWRDIMTFQLQVEDEPCILTLVFSTGRLSVFNYAQREIQVTKAAQESGLLKLKTGRNVRDFFLSEQGNGIFDVDFSGFTFRVVRMDVLPEEEVLAERSEPSAENGSLPVTSPMPGKVIRINVKQGTGVKKGEPLAVVEAMKMENQIKAQADSFVEKIRVKEGDKVDAGEILLILKIKK